MTVSQTQEQPETISLRTAFWYWLKLGFISFGGPAGQIAMMHIELVEKRRWISENRFLHALNYCMLLPGPEATQLAVYIGWLMHKTAGGLLAGILFIFPSLLMLIGLSWLYVLFGQHAIVTGILYGIKPAIVAIVLGAAWRIAQRSLKTRTLMVISFCALIAITLLQVPFPAIIVAAAVAGILFRHQCSPISANPHAAGNTQQHAPALIDDHTPTPPHARFSWKGLFRFAAAGLLTGSAVWLTLFLTLGLSNPLTQMGWFFTKTALLSFGGAYSVLPYVFQAAVGDFHWLTTPQMMDGLALGETTPGPLIMVVAFVGFIGGWSTQAMGAGATAMAGIAGATVACFFTFLPSFVFILAGGPLVESSRHQFHLTAPLRAISAAVVGVIISLAFFFANHVFFNPLHQPDLPAIGLTAAACIAIFRYKTGTVILLLIFSFLGFLIRQLT
ncbi:chromate efflux transporter [Undibacterium griseum]|uniref:Chromate efflux transporter n=1 Tax=Undibacterium griseum TaxID=2762295 RepID=A0ABR6YQL1_9BURK|nr:chromate efflux transporter [Undibacterium griseum]MBC3886189.1 chromate efflux transporter [Undibacterium griseum]